VVYLIHQVEILEITNKLLGGRKMINWNEFVVFWQEEQMNFFVGILFAMVIARVLGSWMAQDKARIQTRSKKNTTEKAGN
jgi:hypothetical protein